MIPHWPPLTEWSKYTSARVLVALLLAIGLLSGGCSSTHQQTSSLQTSAIASIPDWYANPIQNTGYIDGLGSGESPDMEIAISKARTTARGRIAEGISTQTALTQKRFAEEIGVDADGETSQFFQSVNRDIAVETLTGVVQKEQAIQDNGRGGYRVFTWLQLPVGEVNRQYLERIRGSKIAETRLRATKAFEELESSVKEYDASRAKPATENH